MNTVDKIMALAGIYADSNRSSEGPDKFAWEALRAAIVEALGMGEPVAWMGFHPYFKTYFIQWPGEPRLDVYEQWQPLYAPKEQT